MEKNKIRDYAEQEFHTLFKGVDIDKENENEIWLKELYVNAFLNGVRYSLCRVKNK